MRIATKATPLYVFAMILFVLQLWGTNAPAFQSYFTSQGCSAVGCHAPPVLATCNGCHGHGTHPDSVKNTMNVAGTTDKATYTPGETVTVTITGGYRTGWIRAVLYDQNTTELARSTGNDSGQGGSTIFPAVLSAPAPATPGQYTWKVAWYGNTYDLTEAGAGTTTFGPGWTPDPANPNHGAEIVNITTPFTVGSQPARIIRPPAPPLYYPDLLTAYTNAIDNDIIQSQTQNFVQDLNIAKILSIQGGFDALYANITGNTALTGIVTITTGSVILANLEIH